VVALDFFEPITKLVQETITVIMAELGTFWVGMPTDNVDSADSPARWVQGELFWLTFTVATISVVIAGAKMALSSRGQSARDVLRSLLTLIVVMGIGLTVIELLIEIGDQFSKCMIASSITDQLANKDPKTIGLGDLRSAPLDQWKCDVDEQSRKDFGASMLAVLGLAGPAGGVMGIVLMMFIGAWGIIASAVQVMMMIVRNGMLVVLVGVLPVAAAATNTETGRAWFKRCLSWLTAFLLYKPVAAFIYAAALKLMTTSSIAVLGGSTTADTAGAMKNGITAAVMMTLAIVAMPALMKFMTPLVAATAGGAGLMAMTTAGQAGHQLVASSHDEAAADITGDGPTGATNTGSNGAPSQTGRQGATGSRGASGKPGTGSKTTSGKGDASGGKAPSTGGKGNDAPAQGPGGGGGGDGGASGQGGTGGSGGSSGPGGGGSGGGSGGGGGPKGGGGHGSGPSGMDTVLGGQDGPGGSSGMLPGTGKDGPGGAKDAAEVMRKFGNAVDRAGHIANKAIDEAGGNHG